MPTTADAVLIDVGTGNLHSVLNALQSQGFNIQLTSEPAHVLSARRLILPGVGAFGAFMQGLQQRNLEEPIRKALAIGTPLLGICVGMQALLDVGTEMGEYPGLGLIQGEVIRFPTQTGFKVPHNGWNQLQYEKTCVLFDGLPAHPYVYFTHSYYCAVSQKADWAASTDYGLQFASAVQKNNIFGVQFHPEKSQKVGQKILANFFKQ